MADEPITPHAIAESALDRGGRASWGAIFAGTAVAAAALLALGLLGLAIGAVDIDPRARDAVEFSLVAIGIFVFVSQLIALGAGGFVAGRLAGVLHSMGAMMHGAAVWAVVTLLTAWIATSAATGLFNVATSAIQGALSGATSAAQAVIPDDLSLPDVSASSLSMEDLPEPVRARLRQNGITPETFRTEAREALRSVVSQSEQARAREEVLAAGQDILTSPGDAGQDVAELTDALFGRGAVFSEEDRAEAVAVMERRLGLTPEEAEAYLDEMQARAEELQADAETALEEARIEALEAAEAANGAVRAAALAGFIASLLGLAAAIGGALAGRVKTQI